MECRDVPDEAYFDGQVAASASSALRECAERGKPFFLAVGFWKPHTPFNAPKKYWDLYDRSSITLPQNLKPPRGVPELALTNARFRSSNDLQDLKEMHHGHLAAISYLDQQIGKVLQTLDDLSLSDDTIVVFFSDHGLHLGEHGLTRKTTAFELDAHVPLMIALPGQKDAKRISGLVELLDLFPTLTELCDIPAPHRLAGTSLVPLLGDSTAAVKKIAMTQTPRPNYPRGRQPEHMGYSIRSDRFRYTEWRNFHTNQILFRELYDHKIDPGETDNLIDSSAHVVRIRELAVLLQELIVARK